MKWYVVNVYSGFEYKAVDFIRDQASKKGLSASFGEILIPTEKVIEIKKGTKIDVEKKFFPGYIIVEMELIDETWHVVTSYPKCAGFLGVKGKPSPIMKKEVDAIMKKVADSSSNVRRSIIYEIGETVKVCEGPFATFNGVVEEIDEDKNRIKVSVSIFGRPTNVDLGFTQVEKIKWWSTVCESDKFYNTSNSESQEISKEVKNRLEKL